MTCAELLAAKNSALAQVSTYQINQTNLNVQIALDRAGVIASDYPNAPVPLDNAGITARLAFLNVQMPPNYALISKYYNLKSELSESGIITAQIATAQSSADGFQAQMDAQGC